jgi:putative glutamine amidotransferase
MKTPLIGLTTDHSPSTDQRPFAKGVDIYYHNDVYIRYAEKGECLFVGLPTTGKHAIIPDMVHRLDGLLLTGGNDVYSGAYGETILNPSWQFDEPRTWYEIALIEEALRQDKPIYGLCRGAQMLNVALGGSLYQDIPTQVPHAIQHRSPEKPKWNYHPVKVQQESRLYNILRMDTISVSTSHHQAINKLAPGLQAIAHTSDGLVEAIEMAERKFVVGVQWHPEVMGDDPGSLGLLQAFLEACRAA